MGVGKATLLPLNRVHVTLGETKDVVFGEEIDYLDNLLLKTLAIMS